MKDISKVELETGSHESLEKGACVMELVSYIADEPWSEYPLCTSPVLAAYARRYNDISHPDFSPYRQRLKALIPKLIGTRDGLDKQRMDFLVLQSITIFLPILTDALELKEISEKLRSFKSGEWEEARAYINSSIRPKIKTTAAAYGAAAAAAAAYADAIDAYDAGASVKWKNVRNAIWEAGFVALEKACEIK